MNPSNKGKTLLWALRSPCNLHCQYCYFNTLDYGEDNATTLNAGVLNHYSRNDLSLDEILSFISRLKGIVKRVFIAGGEPLIWNGIRQVVSDLLLIGCEVIICTNGLPLVDEDLSSWLINVGVSAISVSLDSYDAKYNDSLRVDKTGQGWWGVVEGINTLLKIRQKQNSKLKVGIYSVVTKLNIEHLERTCNLAISLNNDYFIIQPISLQPEHKLYKKLSLDMSDYKQLEEIIEKLKPLRSEIKLPDDLYFNLLLKSITFNMIPINECFAGNELFFIEPDGSIWDCPSIHRISNTCIHKSILDRYAIDTFNSNRRCESGCNYFSRDCVNMWQLMAFDDIL